jgi:hypothetical protein
MTAVIPFAFEVGKETMPPGRYEVIRPANTTAMVIRNTAGGAMRLLGTGPEGDNRSGRNGFVFHAFGTHYFLSGIAVAHSGRMYLVRPSRSEAEMARVTQPVTLIQTAE